MCQLGSRQGPVNLSCASSRDKLSYPLNVITFIIQGMGRALASTDKIGRDQNDAAAQAERH